jgi:hypothetical protein
VATAGTIGGLVEITMEKNSGSALLSTCRTTINAHSVDIHIRILGRCGLDPGDSVGESCIFQVLIANLLELLASVTGSHGIELYNDEAKFREGGGVAVIWLEGLGNVAVAWARIDILYDRIFLRWIEVGGPLDDTPHGSDTIATGGYKDFRGDPSGGGEGRDVGGSEGYGGSGTAEHSHLSGGRSVLSGVGVDKGREILIEAGIMVGWLGSEICEVSAVEIYATIMDVVGILIGVYAIGSEIDDTILFIDMEDAANTE